MEQFSVFGISYLGSREREREREGRNDVERIGRCFSTGVPGIQFLQGGEGRGEDLPFRGRKSSFPSIAQTRRISREGRGFCRAKKKSRTRIGKW